MALLTFPGSDGVMAAHAPALPQPDQLCGPFSAQLALHAVLTDTDVPDVLALANASGTTIWPEDVSTHRPAGAPLVRTGWDELPLASSAESGGTDAAGLIDGLAATVGAKVTVVPIPGAQLTAYRLGLLLTAIAEAGFPLGLLAHVRTGPIAPPGFDWDVGHFIVLIATDPSRGEVTVGDTYAEVTGPVMPRGCRVVRLAHLARALAAPPGRGLILLAGKADEMDTRAMVASAGLTIGSWST